MRTQVIGVLLMLAVITFGNRWGAWAAQPNVESIHNTGGGVTPTIIESPKQPGWLERDRLTGDWGGDRTWLKEHGILLKPRLTQFVQGMPSGNGDHDFEYGGKADLLLHTDLGKLGLWNGLSLTVHGEYNFGESVDGYGGTIALVNTALSFPGMEGSERSDLSSVYFAQRFGHSVSLLLGKINIIDLASTRPFLGGAGIDSFWNVLFVAPPNGIVPPYIFGAVLSARTEPARFGLWVYDPEDVVNKTGFEDPFGDGVTIRGNVDFPVTIAGRGGHHGFVAAYSNKGGPDLQSMDEILIPSYPGTVDLKEDRYYFAYAFDQVLYQSQENPSERVGLFGQFGISDGNPNKLYWVAVAGVGGTGLVPSRSRDNWGVGYYYVALSSDLKDSLERILNIRDEQGLEIFYNFSITPWLTLGADLQIIDPSLADDRAVFIGLRTVIRF